mgnify:CR=1 FL=1
MSQFTSGFWEPIATPFTGLSLIGWAGSTVLCSTTATVKPAFFIAVTAGGARHEHGDHQESERRHQQHHRVVRRLEPLAVGQHVTALGDVADLGVGRPVDGRERLPAQGERRRRAGGRWRDATRSASP